MVVQYAAVRQIFTFSVCIVCWSRNVIIVDGVNPRDLIFYKLATLRATAHSRPSSLAP